MIMNFEAGYCSRQEYMEKESTRLSEADLIVDELYLLMTALVSTVELKSAAKIPTRITGVNKRESGFYSVSLILLDHDLNPLYTENGFFRDGYWVDASKQIQYDEYDVDNAYITGYQDPWETDAHRLYESLLLST